MPPTYTTARSHSYTRPYAATRLGAAPAEPASLNAPGSTRSRKRKGTPYKSPARTISTSGSSSSAGSSSSSSSRSTGSGPGGVINVSALLRAIAKEGTRELDNIRYKPAPLPSPASSPDKLTTASAGAKKKSATHYKRDVLIPMDHDYGRGKRSSSLGGGTTRTRSALAGAAGKGKGKLTVPPVSAATSMRRSLSQDPPTTQLLPPRSPQLQQLSTSGRSVMNRSTSLGPSPHVPFSSATGAHTTSTAHLSTTPLVESQVVVGSPLARSFTKNVQGEIEETLADGSSGRRSRNPSSGGRALPWSTAQVSPNPSPRTSPQPALQSAFPEAVSNDIKISA
ncbi:uncharacterized protein JCM15063_000060 [Sporobolomyces koalae]|uniref:uncharacterized protein n=1 Tax=Sporobolomyces koalae TaxID=500713 RepID=UPI00318241EA